MKWYDAKKDVLIKAHDTAKLPIETDKSFEVLFFVWKNNNWKLQADTEVTILISNHFCVVDKSRPFHFNLITRLKYFA